MSAIARAFGGLRARWSPLSFPSVSLTSPYPLEAGEGEGYLEGAHLGREHKCSFGTLANSQYISLLAPGVYRQTVWQVSSCSVCARTNDSLNGGRTAALARVGPSVRVRAQVNVSPGAPVRIKHFSCSNCCCDNHPGRQPCSWHQWLVVVDGRFNCQHVTALVYDYLFF